MSKIISVGTAVPKYETDQSAILDFMCAAYHDDSASRKLKILFHLSGISTRYSAVSDFKIGNCENPFFSDVQNPPTVEKRSEQFKKHAASLAIEAILQSLQKIETTIAEFGITHLITVTCTGLYAPGIDTEIIEQLNLPDDIFHTSVNFMGCNAAMHALKLGDMIAKTDRDARVMIVCVELCTLHFQPKNNHDNLLSNTIFGDGAAAVVIVPDTHPWQFHQKGIAITGFYSLLLNKGKDLIGWNITPLNFEMVLDAKVPEFIGEEVKDLVMKAEKKLNMKITQISKWAIHPGGKKILDTIQKQLKLKDADMQFSYKVLKDYGNMSSPTILFVLNEILKAENKPNETIFAMGFGPGLSIDTALLTYAE